MGSSTTCKVAGYWYKAGMHLVFCTGVDELLEIVVGEKSIWKPGEISYGYKWVYDPYCVEVAGSDSKYYRSPPISINPCVCSDAFEPMRCIDNWSMVRTTIVAPSVTSNATLGIFKKNIFGGEDREGGIEGYMDVEFGLPDQGRNSYLLTKQGANIPAYRGVFAFVLRGMTLSCNSPSIKPWAIRARRTKTGFEPNIDRIGDDMNPVHIIEECLFSANWGGVGLPVSKRGDSFAFVALQLYTENFGLSFLWTRNESIDDFINIVLRHINAVLYQDYETGKLELKLIRDDYGSPSTLPVFNTSNIISLENYNAKSTADLVNTVTIKFTDPKNGKDQSITLTDPSAVDRNGGIISLMERDFYGVTVTSLASQIATRELRATIAPMATVTFLTTRAAFESNPGDVINFTWLPIGIVDAPMRIISIDIGYIDSSVIRVDAALDVFAFGDSMLVDPPDSGDWDDPINEPQDLVEFTAREATYWQVSRLAGLIITLDPESSSLLYITAKKPLADARDFELWDNIPGTVDYKIRASGTFSEYYYTAQDVKQEIETQILLTIPLEPGDILDGTIGVGSHAYLGEELIYIVAINETFDVISVARATTDTVPIFHPAGTEIQFISSAKCAMDNQIFVETEDVNFKMLTSTSTGRLHIDDATEQNYVFKGRFSRPYPPGNVKFGNNSYPDSEVLNPEVEYYPSPIDSTTVRSALGSPWLCIDPLLLKTDTSSGTSWYAESSIDQKLSWDLGDKLLFNILRIFNYHNTGASTDIGIKDFTLYGTNSFDAFANTDYLDETDLTLIGTYQANQHPLTNTESPQEILIPDTQFRYVVMKISTNWGNLTGLGIRHIEVLSLAGHLLSYSTRNRHEQIATIPISQSDTDITPEVDVLYNVTTTDVDTNTLIENITGTDKTKLFLKNLDPVSLVKITVEADKLGELSHQKHDFTTRLVGYGKSYGYNYGGM